MPEPAQRHPVMGDDGESFDFGAAMGGGGHQLRAEALGPELFGQLLTDSVIAELRHAYRHALRMANSNGGGGGGGYRAAAQPGYAEDGRARRV